MGRLSEIHEERPEFPTVSFLSEMWERMVYRYGICVSEGVHYILSRYDEGVTLEEIRRYALAPNGQGGTAWRFTPIFDFDDEDGFWRSVILPGIKQERQRQDIMNLVAARERSSKKGDRYGGDEESPGVVDEKPKPVYPTGTNLSAVERKMGYAHKPLGKKGKAICYNFIAHAGCAKGDACLFSHLQRIRPEGLHWTVKYDLARRGGLVSGKRIEPVDVEGFLLALRSQNAEDLKRQLVKVGRVSGGVKR